MTKQRGPFFILFFTLSTTWLCSNNIPKQSAEGNNFCTEAPQDKLEKITVVSNKTAMEKEPRALSEKELRNNCLAALNALTCLAAEFREIHEDGTMRTGMLYLQRPTSTAEFGKIRLDYHDPSIPGIIATEGKIYRYHPESLPAQSIPITATPIAHLLRHRIVLGNTLTDRGCVQQGNQVFWTLTETPNELGEISGVLTIIFKRENWELGGWQIEDIYGKTTVIELTNLRKEEAFKPSFFEAPQNR